MKLGIDCRDLLADSLNGIGRFVRNLLAAIPSVESPPRLVLYGNQRTAFPATPPGATTRRAPERWTGWWDAWTLPRLVRRDAPDVFLSPYYKAPRIRSCPVVVTVHDLLFLRLPPPASGRGPSYCRAFRVRAARSARRAAAVLTVSECSRREVIEHLRVPREKTHVVGHCVPPGYGPATEAAIAAAKEAYNIEGEYVLYVGHFGPHKNVRGLLRAYAALDGEIRDRFGLVLAGRPGRHIRWVLEDADRLGIKDRLWVTDHIDEDHLPAVYSGAAALVTLSLWEGFGLPVLEAMACGTPVLCSDRAALPETAGGAAVLVDPEDLSACSGQLARILSDDALRADLREKGLARAKEFSPEAFAGRLLRALHAAIEVSRR